MGSRRRCPAATGWGWPFDLQSARILATYRVPEHASYDDALIAAVAESAGMTVATRNVRHFEPLGVRRLDPWRDPR
ncbi:PIN domain-containing protein [Tsukamurella soli]|uniref:PIN domain-containing protein n=1 Tax=Tsukamurella soli TaxID=644556 RepID=A0ABP8K7I3_9ACTN